MFQLSAHQRNGDQLKNVITTNVFLRLFIKMVSIEVPGCPQIYNNFCHSWPDQTTMILRLWAALLSVYWTLACHCEIISLLFKERSNSFPQRDLSLSSLDFQRTSRRKQAIYLQIILSRGSCCLVVILVKTHVLARLSLLNGAYDVNANC